MKTTRSLSCIIGVLVLVVVAGCAPKDPRSRIQSAISMLTSDAGSSGKAEACNTLTEALAEIPSDAPDRKELVTKAAAALETAVLGSDQEVQNAAVGHLADMDEYLQANLVALLSSDDAAVRERAERVFTTMGERITPLLGMSYISILEPFADPKPGWYSADVGITSGEFDPDEGIPGMKKISETGQERMMAFVRIFSKVGDGASALALLAGATTIRKGHPRLAAENWKALEALGPEKIALLPDEVKSTYQAMKASQQ